MRWFGLGSLRKCKMLNRSVTVAEPATEPLTLAEAKKHLEIAESDDTHDEHVGSLITYARQRLETDIQQLLITREVVEKASHWLEWPYRLYYRPAVAVSSVKYWLGTQLTLSTSIYSFDSDRALLHLGYGQSLPSYDERWDSIQVTYTAGYGTFPQQIPQVFRQAMKLLIENAFEDRHKDATSLLEAYHNLIQPYGRATYP